MLCATFCSRLVLICPLFLLGLLGHTLGPYYTNNLDLTATMGMVSGFDAIVRRAIVDDLKLQSPTFDMSDQSSAVAYLKRISTNMGNFRASGGVVGRQRERKLIAKYFQTKGTMAFIGGGPSVGKTKLLDHIIKVDMKMRNSEGGAGRPIPLRVVLFDGRAVDSLHQALHCSRRCRWRVCCPRGALLRWRPAQVPK